MCTLRALPFANYALCAALQGRKSGVLKKILFLYAKSVLLFGDSKKCRIFAPL